MASVPTAERATSSTLYFGPWYRRSPFFEKTLDAGCSAYDIYNHMYLPGYYADPVEEYWHLLNAVTVWDVSVERIVEITGPDASAFVNTLTCRDLTKCAVGQGKYVLITAEDGGIVNDPVLLRVEENRWWLALADSDAGLWARGVAVHSGMDVTVREPEVYPIQVQGPKSKDVMQTLFGDAVLDIRYYWTLTTELDGIPVVISRTGWTGEVGYEIYLKRPVARRRAVGPGHGGRQAPRHPADRAVRGAPHRGRHLQLQLGHDDREQPVRDHGPRAPRRAPGRRLHRQGRPRGDPGHGRQPQARRHRGRRRRALVRDRREAPGAPPGREGRPHHGPHLVAEAREEHRLRVGPDRARRRRASRSRSTTRTARAGPARTAAIPFLDAKKDIPKA